MGSHSVKCVLCRFFSKRVEESDFFVLNKNHLVSTKKPLHYLNSWKKLDGFSTSVRDTKNPLYNGYEKWVIIKLSYVQ